MALPRRNLTFRFPKSVVTATGHPETMVVSVVPLATPSAPGQGTYVGGVQEAEIVLSQDVNVVLFELLPSDHPTLTERVVYRIGWRSKYLGRETKYDIVMPDQDIFFDQLDDLGAVLGGEVYLHQADRSRPGGVAGLDDQGRVIDATGIPVTGDGSAAGVGVRLDQEVLDRQSADLANRNALEAEFSAQYQSVLQTTASNLALAVSNLNAADNTEAGVRATAVANLNTALQALQVATNNSIDILNNNLSTLSATTALKADLDTGGKLKVSQVPDVAIPKAVPVANQAAMLALTSVQVQPGDLAVRPDGIWFLNATNPAVLANWVLVEAVSSVNGKTGIITLVAGDVGARALGTDVPLTEVAGLNAALNAKTNSTVVTALAGRVTAIETDTKIVRLNSSNVIDHNLLDSGVAYIDNGGQIVRKDGTVIAVGGGGVISSVNGKTGVVVISAGDVGARSLSVPLVFSDVTGLQDALNAKVDTSDNRMSNARQPTPHAFTHLSSGADPLLPIQITDVVDLVLTLTRKTDTTVSITQGNRISSLETRVAAVEGGGGGTPGTGTGGIAKTVWFDGTSYTNDIFGTVRLKSPFGLSGSGAYYYDPAGAADNEWVWPYVTPNGHLQLRKWDESGPADPDYALQSSLTTLATIVSGKADASTVAAKANQTALDATNSAVALKASQSSVDALSTTVAGKANQSDLTNLTTVVTGKAAQSDLTTLTGRVSTAETTLGTKADLSGGFLAAGQLPNVPQSKVTGLAATLSLKADLDSGGALQLSQVPTNIPQTSIVGLASAFAGKADLGSDGKLLSSQIPSLATSETYVVVNRAAMLALSSTQVQRGDVAVITGATDRGSYILNTNDPTQFSNWVPLATPDGAVSSVNGQQGTVVLTASDVGARNATTAIPQADVTGLAASLASKADAAATSADLATRTTSTDVRNILTASTLNKQQVGYVATTAVASLSGQQTADGVLMPIGSTVLLTAQSSSIQNGVYTVQSGAWSRASDFATGSYFVRGSVVTAGPLGNTNSNTLWQLTATSGVTDVNANNWTRIGYVAAPYIPAQGNGIVISGNVSFAVRPTTGITVTSAGVGIDTTLVPRKFSIDVPGGSTTPTITHGLGTLDVQVTVRDKGTGDAYAIGWTATGTNAIVLEFGNVPATGQWRVVVIG